MAEKTVRFGLWGAGLIAPFHAKSIRAAQNCELVAIAGRSFDKVSALAQTFQCKAYHSLQELLDDKSIDVLVVLTPNDAHYEATIAAAKAGKSVLVEKPPAVSLKQTDEMIRACRQAKVHLGIVLQCRVRKPIQAMKQAIAQGRFGKILQADAFMKWYRAPGYYHSNAWRSSWQSGAGVTIQHAFHYIDLLQYLVGPARSVHARMSNRAHQDVQLEDTLMSFVDWENGAQGVVVASTALWPGIDLRIELHGEKGTAIMVGERMDTWKFQDERPEDEQIRTLGRKSVGTAASGPADFDFADHQVVIEDMARCVRQGGEPIITADSARVTLEIALAMYQSSATGQAVSLPVANEEAIWAHNAIAAAR